MRLTEKDTTTVYLKKREVTVVPKLGEKIVYGSPKELQMSLQAAEGLVMAQIYGNKLNTVKTAKYIGTDINEGENELDGVCIFVPTTAEPDFHITSIKTYSQHKTLILERL